MILTVFDLESDGLLDSVTKIHCLSYTIIDTTENTRLSGTLTEYQEIISFILKQDVLIGHNIVKYDIPVLNKILRIKITAQLIDTLGLSWYLYPNRNNHGLEYWGEDLGILKPIVEDWSALSLETYIHRCEEDVKINTLLFSKQYTYLLDIYGSIESLMRFCRYITFKLDCAREQEEIKLKLDIPLCKNNLQILTLEKQKRVEILSKIMLPKNLYKIASRPKVMYKKDGELSEHGKKWMQILEEQELPSYHLGAIKLVKGQEEGNPNSHAQVKEWLFGLGWIPDVFKYEKEDDGSIRKIPQISEDGDITQSVKDLVEVNPELTHLAGYYVISHRIGVLQGFIEAADEKGFVKAEIAGLANTLRFQHKKPICNLPSSPKAYWEMIRGCIIADSDKHLLCGFDMVSLEDNTKQHYMYFFDPEYVKEMRTPGFDPHLDIGLLANMLTREEAELHKLYDKTKGKEGVSFKTIRSKAKKVNFSGVYGAGPAKIALAANIPLLEAKILHTTYWERNKAVKQVAQACIVKTVNNQMWLYNPISKFWYSLRADKDRFSTCNQSSGVYAFDTCLSYVRKAGIKLSMQYHDEGAFSLLIEDKNRTTEILNEAIKKTNEQLKLNIELAISIDYGNSYSETH